MRPSEVPVPPRLQNRPTFNDYPVPFIVMNDDHGKPQFTVNDIAKQIWCVTKKHCPICGEKLPKELWFVGGPLSAFHEYGSYFDSAMHYECMEYALKVCPWLAMSKYNSTMDARFNVLDKKMGEILVETTINPGKPKVFVALMTYGQSTDTDTRNHQLYIKPLRPYHKVEFWKFGQQLSYEEGLAIVREQRHLNQTHVDRALRLIGTNASSKAYSSTTS